MIKIRTALLSVSDKTGIVPLARVLAKKKISILSTGGTAALLKKTRIPCTEIADYTGVPELLGGRVKTLHPKIHGGILARREESKDRAQLKKHKIQPIDLVVVNLYPFEETTKKKVSLREAIENIDIGGVTLLRSAAKNYKHVAVASSPSQYEILIDQLKKNRGAISEKTAQIWAVEAFHRTAGYDRAITQYLSKIVHVKEKEAMVLPHCYCLCGGKIQDLRYGENPHQKGAWYHDEERWGLAQAKQLHGKELSFNNLVDLDAALALVSEFNEPTAAIMKHASPCGVAQAQILEEVFRQAYEADSLSAFGGIIGFNAPVDEATAEAIVASGFLECLIAPGYSGKALSCLKQKKNLRILQASLHRVADPKESWDIKRIHGGFLLQEWDTVKENLKEWKSVTAAKPTADEMNSALFAWKVAKFVRSNAIVVCQGTRSVGICGGQPSRVDAVKIAVEKAGEKARGAVLASDAFFPMADNVEVAARAGISLIVQPGGSIRDAEVIAAANQAGIAMVFTGVRHFRH